ncbi:MAG: thioredoxin-like domain-containing protein [Bacteroidales bacterium]|nr:redoxin domain-containing protein [Lentimicrobiaceae bacterium]MDD5694381.1 thioredoxin-like domain-containing protein [Bacteroidales bacterium]
MKRIFPFLFILTSLACFSQSHHQISGTVTNLKEPKVYLASFYGEQVHVIDSVTINQDGSFVFSYDASRLPGYYRIILKKDHYVDLILNNEDVSFATDFNEPLDSLKILQSVENQIYYGFLERAGKNRLRQDLLTTLIDYYPKDDAFYPEIREQYHAVQKDTEHYADSIQGNFPSLYVTRVIKAQGRPFLSADLSVEERINYLRSNYWSSIDMTDTELLRSTVYTSLAIDYMSLYGNRQFTQEQLEAAFIEAVDVMLTVSMANETVYRFMLEYLVKGFEKYHFDKVLDHISTTYALEEGCENENIDSEVMKRLKNYQNLSVGKPAPAVSVPDTTGKLIELQQFSNDYLLIIFWASWCPHCSELMPRLKEVYQKYRPRLEMLAISIDSKKEDYMKALREGNFPWLNGCDLKGWGSKPAVDFNVYATPTMFLLDRQKTILAKPITLRELQNELGKVFNF